MSKKKNKTLMAGWMERGMSRPLALGVFAASALILLLLEVTSRRTLSVDGIGRAPSVALAATAPGVVSQVRVQSGERVNEGDVLLTIEASEIRRQLAQVDADIRRTIREGRYEQARLADETQSRQFDQQRRLAEARARSLAARAQARAREDALSQLETQAETVRREASERMLPASEARSVEMQLLEERLRATEAGALLRSELDQLHSMRDALPSDPSSELTRALVDLWESELELLRVQREGLDRQLEQLTIRATMSGRVIDVLAAGAPVTIETTVARIVPEHATEVVAYLPPDTDRFAFADSAREISVRAGSVECIGTLPVHAGAEVELAPGQLTTAFLGRPVYGLPLYIELPPDCRVGAGQLVHVSLVDR